MNALRRRRVCGFSMMEALVTLVVMSVGLLGASRLVNASLAFTDSAELRSQSVILAYDLVEKIRANPDNAAAYAIGMDEAVGEPPDCVETACDGADVATADLADWKDQIEALLPAGAGESVVTATDATITIEWTDRGVDRDFTLVMGL